MTLYCRSLPLDVAARIWDSILGEGEWAIFKVAIGILNYFSPQLSSGDFSSCCTLLTSLPQVYY